MVTLHAYGVPYISPQVEYFNSDIVLIGKVISATPFSPTHMKYEIQVEQYLKNPQPQNKMTVIADGTNKTLVERGMAPDTVFNVGQRAFLYLKNDQGNYTVWWFSHSTDSLCDPAPTQADLNFEYPKGVDFAYDPLHIDATKSNSYLFSVNQPVVISYDTWNRHFTTTTFDVEFDVKNGTDGKEIFNDTQHITLKPCLGHQTVTTSFIPKIAGTYEVDVIFDNSLLGGTLEIPKNHSHPVTMQEPPLKQLKEGITSVNILCNESLVKIMKLEDNSPACVKPLTQIKLEQYGWTLPITQPNKDIIYCQKNPSNACNHTMELWYNDCMGLQNENVSSCHDGRIIAYLKANGLSNSIYVHP
jgi:hypothetical protein